MARIAAFTFASRGLTWTTSPISGYQFACPLAGEFRSPDSSPLLPLSLPLRPYASAAF